MFCIIVLKNQRLPEYNLCEIEGDYMKNGELYGCTYYEDIELDVK
jgi:hypothetical protein